MLHCFLAIKVNIQVSGSNVVKSTADWQSQPYAMLAPFYCRKENRTAL